MNASRIPLAARLLPLALGVLATGCATFDAKQEVLADSRVLQKGPEIAPARSITNFSAGLRCMDNLLLESGTRDVALITEDILDETKKVNAGTKDMLISAVSDMTRRSHALKLIAYGKDSGNTIGYLFQAQDRNIYAAIPQYSIKGSISQFDESIARKNVDAGIGFEPFVSVGAAKTASSSVLGLDLTVLSTQDLSVVPGVNSRNQVLIIKDGKGVDGEATIKKFGINFSMNVSRNEGQAQALRTLVELAAIELVGKLAKVPYWACVGANPDDESVRNEVSDWYESLKADPRELLGWAATQMRQRGLYDGPIDGDIDQAQMRKLRDAISTYRAALGMSREPKLSLEFYSAYLRANHAQVMAKIASEAPRPVAKALGPAPLALAVGTADGRTRFTGGEAMSLVVKPGRDAHVYCYLRDETQRIQRFYPNRFVKDSLIRANTPLLVPGTMRFQLVANDKKVPESVACFASERDIMKDLPASVTGIDFENLPVDSMEELKSTFASVSGGGVAQATFDIEFR